MFEFIFCKRKSGFTLIELLVVIAIIALLLAVLVPTLATAKQRAKIAVCKSNFHQWGIAVQLYANDNDGWYPAHDIPGGTGQNTWDIGYQFVLVMHDDYDIPYKEFYCPAQQQNKYPGDDITAFREIMWWSLLDQSAPADSRSTELSAFPYLAMLRFSWWIPRQSGSSGNQFWIPVEFGEDASIQPENTAPRRDFDSGAPKPILTDFCRSPLTGSDPVFEDIDYGGHWIRGQFHSVNLLYADGHVEVHKENDIQPRFTSMQMHHWW